MNDYPEKIARILRADKRVVENLEQSLEKATGRAGVFRAILEEDEKLFSDRLAFLGLSRNSLISEVYDALISKIEADDLALLRYMGLGVKDTMNAAQKTVEFAKLIHPSYKGFFLKKEKAKQLLIAEPPKIVLRALGYKSVEAMLAKEDLFEIYSALRFLEGSEWLNSAFFKQYEILRPDDFEERTIDIRALHPKWAKAAEKFVAKKYHNVSHLKELGVIFVIPIFLGISGETLRVLSLLLHYLHEVKFYSDLFKDFSSDGESFSDKIIALLRGDTAEAYLPDQPASPARPRFLIIPRYLAKDNDNDQRLFEPHINTEAIHWQKAEDEIANISSKVPDFQNGFEFWKDLGSAGDLVKTDVGTEVLVSFNLVDTVMGLVKRKELIKYLYHQQEALWNKIFIKYFDVAQLEAMSRKYISRGWFEI